MNITINYKGESLAFSKLTAFKVIAESNTIALHRDVAFPAELEAFGDYHVSSQATPTALHLVMPDDSFAISIEGASYEAPVIELPTVNVAVPTEGDEVAEGDPDFIQTQEQKATDDVVVEQDTDAPVADATTPSTEG